jgi:hypothetical protein
MGVGARVASKMLRDRATQTTQTVQQNAPAYAARGKSTVAGARKGAKRFGESIWGPFAHAGSVLWLEVTGLFFALFALFFVQGAYRLRANWHSGPGHERLLIYVAVAVLFFYFAASSFYRARKKQQKRNARLREQL